MSRQKGFLFEEDEDYQCYNCAGYALDYHEWYCPYSTISLFKLVSMGIRNGDKTKNIYKRALKMMTKQVLEDFPTLTTVKNPNKIGSKRPLIGMRVGLIRRGNMYLDHDFHFIKRENGEWSHKLGGYPAEYLSKADVKKVWAGDGIDYDSKVIWFTSKTFK